MKRFPARSTRTAARPRVRTTAIEDEAPSAERILRFKAAIGQGPDAMAAFMDVDVTTSCMAVDRVIMNDDGAFHFYCIAHGAGNNPTTPGNQPRRSVLGSA